MVCTILETPICWASESLPEWYQAARKHVEADTRLIGEASSTTDDIVQILKARDATIEKLKDLPHPTLQELNQLIQSTRLEDREAALVTTMTLELHDYSLIKTILANYEKEQGFLAKFYSHQVLSTITTSQLRAVEKQLFRILRHEKDGPILFVGLQTVARLDREKRALLFAQYMETGSDALLRACTVALAQLGKSDLEAVKTRLKRLKAKKAVAFLDRFGEATLREIALQNDR